MVEDGTIVDDDDVLSDLKDSVLMVLSESQVWHPVESQSTKSMQNTASVKTAETVQGNGQLRIMCHDGQLQIRRPTQGYVFFNFKFSIRTIIIVFNRIRSKLR